MTSRPPFPRAAALLCRALCLAALLAPACFGQFSLYLVNGNVEQPVPATLDFGSLDPAQSASALFRIRNTSSQPAALNLLAVNGAGFSLPGAPALPYGLNPQQSLDLTVVFQAGVVGSYSASFDTPGASVVLTATVLPSLTYQVQLPYASATLGASAIDFGGVQVGGSAALHFTVTNLTDLVLAAPGIAVQGSAFSLPQPPPAGVVFQPGDSAGFDVAFQPAAVGTASGALLIGDRTYPLTGTGLTLPLPSPVLAFTLPQAVSGQQGTVAVTFAAPAQAAGAGNLTLQFRPLAGIPPAAAGDPAIQLGIVGSSAAFNFSAADTAGHFGGLSAVAFQTGTTAGTLVFSASIGASTASQSMAIPAAPVTILSASGQRGSSSLQLTVAAFDNTRSAGPITYTFFDAAGTPIAPPVAVDSTAAFAAWFASSGDGGNFLLQAVFPVNGDISRIAAFAVSFANSAGTAATGTVKF